MKQLVLATRNAGKIAELRALLADWPVQVLVPADLGVYLDVPETGVTYRENATLKAWAYARSTGLPALADDSGLEVAALGGNPGVRSARYAPQAGATDADRRRYLRQQLSDHPPPWTARFRCSAVLAFPEQWEWVGEGECPGVIIPDERGSGGFGYDPIFLLPALGKTMAELSKKEKNRLSHRALAIQDLWDQLPFQ